MLVVIAKIKAAPGKGDELAAKFSEMVAWVTDNEPDTLTYTCNRSTNNPDEFVFFERYPDAGALGAHSQTDQFKSFVGSIGPLLDGGMQVEMLEEVAAKL